MVRASCGFSYSHYLGTLDSMRARFTIGPVSAFKELRRKGRKFVLLRHDVDLSPDSALRMAEEERSRGLASTFYVLPSGPFYNAFSRNNLLTFRRIAQMGHEIGLHYDMDALPQSTSGAKEQLSLMVGLLNSEIGTRIVSVSQHNVTFGRRADRRVTRGFLDSRLDIPDSAVLYLSDSVMNWRRGCMHTHVGESNSMQILTHPIWWRARSTGRAQILREFGRECIIRARSDVNDLSRVYDRYLKSLRKVR